jgi:DNA ligase-1
LPDGTRFSVGTGFSDKERENPPPVGSIITFRYQELSDGGVPRFPSFVGVRPDASTKGATAGLKGSVSGTTFKAPAGKGLPTFGASSRAAPAKPAAPAPAEREEERPRKFEYTEGGSSKFWEVTVKGCEVITRFGKIGSAGQTRIKTFEEDTAALLHATKLIDEKVREGYSEV